MSQLRSEYGPWSGDTIASDACGLIVGATGFTPADGTNTFTAIDQDGLGRRDTNSVTTYLPATNSFVYDGNGNLLSDEPPVSGKTVHEGTVDESQQKMQTSEWLVVCG